MGPMGGYLPYVDFTEFAMALGVFLSALVSLIGTSARKRTISMGEARLSDLAEMTGILQPKQVMAVFGPPDMGRTWPSVSLLDVRRAPAGSFPRGCRNERDAACRPLPGAPETR
jgi:hypothetical protein